jgi:glycosyltransferase involved in cell wall biosynthesis
VRLAEKIYIKSYNMKKNPKYSIITPVHLWGDERVQMFLKTIESVRNIKNRDFEWIIVDDGSTVGFMWEQLMHKPYIIIHQQHEERVIAYSKAFSEAKGDWFVLLDSDDELSWDIFDVLNEKMQQYPQAQMFNFGCEYHHKDGKVTRRDAFMPKREQSGHEKFGGGNIVNGTFVFHKSVYALLGAYPEKNLRDVDVSEINYGKDKRDLYMGTPYDFSAAAQLEFPEIREYFMVDHEDEPEKIIKELGNPWGQDYYLFYKYTRRIHSVPLRECLYIVNPR